MWRQVEPTIGVLAHTEPLAVPGPELGAARPRDDEALVNHIPALSKQLVQQLRPVSGPLRLSSKSSEPQHRCAWVFSTEP